MIPLALVSVIFLARTPAKYIPLALTYELKPTMFSGNVTLSLPTKTKIVLLY